MIIHAGVSASAPASLVAFAADHMLPFSLFFSPKIVPIQMHSAFGGSGASTVEAGGMNIHLFVIIICSGSCRNSQIISRQSKRSSVTDGRRMFIFI